MRIGVAWGICGLVIAVTMACVSEDDGAGLGDAGLREDYPTLGIGTAEGSALANHTFVGQGGQPFAMEQVFKNSSNRLLLVATAAGWCTACIEEQPKLQALHDEYGPRGLFVLVALFEDAEYGPVDATYAADWKTRYELSFEVVADPEFLLQSYYDRRMTPMIMLVNVDGMKILKIMTGFDDSGIDSILQATL